MFSCQSLFHPATLLRFTSRWRYASSEVSHFPKADAKHRKPLLDKVPCLHILVKMLFLSPWSGPRLSYHVSKQCHSCAFGCHSHFCATGQLSVSAVHESAVVDPDWNTDVRSLGTFVSSFWDWLSACKVCLSRQTPSFCHGVRCTE